MEIFKRGKIWHYAGTVAGRRLRGSTGTAERKTAQRIANKIETQAWDCHLDGPGAHVTMAQAIIAYLDAEKSTRFLSKINDYWKDTPLRKITGGAIRQSAIELYPDATGATRNRQVIKPTRAVINHAASLDWCSPIKVKPFPEQKVERVPADAAWVKAFADQADADGLPHLGAMCLFMFATGARVGEATAMMWDDLDLYQRKAKIRQTKTESERTAHLPVEVVTAIANIPSNRQPDERAFGYSGRGSVSKVWNNVAKRAGIEPLTPHCCRHGFATTMLRQGHEVKTIAKLGGWKDAATVLKHYAHALDDPTVTDSIFDTPVTQRDRAEGISA